MKRLTLLLLLVLSLPILWSRQFTFPTQAQQNPITISIASPANNGLSDSNLSIQAAINSTYQVSSVKVKVEDREATLVFSTCAYTIRTVCYPGVAGTLSLAGLARGAKTLTVNVVDVFNNSGLAQRNFIYDQFPRLTINNPIPETVAKPNLRVKLSCTDDDPVGCNNIRISFSDSAVVFQPNNGSFDGEVSLAQFQGQSGNFCISARDSASQLTQACQTIHVESSPMLTEVANVTGKIWDVQGDRILFSEQRNGVDVLKIRNRATGVETELVTLTNKWLQHAAPKPSVFLTPQGAIFVASPTNDVFTNIYEWRDGRLTDLGAGYYDTFKVNGGYAIWASNPSLTLRDLATGTNTEIKPQSGASGYPYLLANGEVIFVAVSASNTSNLYRYYKGQITQLTNKTNVRELYPLSDGKNIVFSRVNGQNFDIILLDESGETALATIKGTPESHLNYYRINNGWVAYSKPDASGSLRVWLRSPSGQEVQKSFFQATTYPDALSSTGESVFATRDINVSSSQWKRYLPVATQLPLTVSSFLGRSFWQDSQLFIIIGRSLFQYTPLASVSAASFSGSTLATEGITAVFGSRLATATQVATTQPLPTSLVGTTVTVRDSLGMQRAAPLFFVSPGQINYQIPVGTVAGQALITISSGDGTVSSGTAQIAAVAPSLFTANASGQGVPAATLLRVKANGEQVYEPVAVFDSNSNQFVARTIQIGPESEQDFLILFGTGLRYRSALSNVTATIRGESVPVFYAGPQPDFVGLDQVNIALPRSLVNRGNVDVVLTADQRTTNAVRISIN